MKVTWPHWRSHDLTEGHVTSLKVTWPHWRSHDLTESHMTSQYYMHLSTVSLRSWSTLHLCWRTWTASTGLGSAVILPSQTLVPALSGKGGERVGVRWGGGRVQYDLHLLCFEIFLPPYNREDLLWECHTWMYTIMLLSHHNTHHSDLPWYKVFFRAMDKISDLKLDHQVINLYWYWLAFCTRASIYIGLINEPTHCVLGLR